MFHQPCTSRVGISSSEKPMACSMAGQYTPWAGTGVFADDFAVRGPELGKTGRPAVRLRQVAGEGNVVDQGVKPDVGDEFGVEREFDSPGKAALGAGNAEVRVKVNGVEHFRLAEGRKDKITALFHELLHHSTWSVRRKYQFSSSSSTTSPHSGPKLPSASRSLSVRNCSWRTE